jgi:hypothetical protein
MIIIDAVIGALALFDFFDDDRPGYAGAPAGKWAQ